MCFLKVSDAFSVATPIGPLGNEKKQEQCDPCDPCVRRSGESRISFVDLFQKSTTTTCLHESQGSQGSQGSHGLQKSQISQGSQWSQGNITLFFSGQVGKVACLLEKSPKPCKTFFFSTTTQMEILLWRFKRRLETWRMLLFDWKRGHLGKLVRRLKRNLNEKSVFLSFILFFRLKKEKRLTSPTERNTGVEPTHYNWLIEEANRGTNLPTWPQKENTGFTEITKITEITRPHEWATWHGAWTRHPTLCKNP